MDQPRAEVAEDVASLVSIDRSSPVPLYFQVAQELQRLIESGTIRAGRRLTNEIAMARSLGVSRPTMRQAIQYLVERGLLVRRQGIGTQVVRNHVRRSLDLTSLHDDLHQAGRNPTTGVLFAGPVEADESVAEALGVSVGAEVFQLRRLRMADNEPIALLVNYLPPGLLDVEPAAFETTGLYDLLRQAGIQIRVADQTIGATRAERSQASLLDERTGAALLTMRRVAYDDLGGVVEYGTHLYRSSRYSFALTLVQA